MIPDRIRVTHPEGGREMTKQAERDAADINVIMRLWKVNGVAPMTGATPRYGDFGDGIDYHECKNRLLQADADFAALPADVRSHVDNDPGAFLDMFSDPEKVEELVELGLVPERIPPTEDTPAVPVPPVEPDAEPVPE